MASLSSCLASNGGLGGRASSVASACYTKTAVSFDGLKRCSLVRLTPYPAPSVSLYVCRLSQVCSAEQQAQRFQETDKLDRLWQIKKQEEKGTVLGCHNMPSNEMEEEWQKQRHEETKELERLRQLENQEEEERILQYHNIGKAMKNFDEGEVRKAKRLVSSLIKSGEEVEERIEEAADNGDLTEVVLLVIQKRLELARYDDERDAMQALDLLYRRIEAEIMKRNSSPAHQLLNELLHLYDGFNHSEWIRKCRKCMLKAFPPEDAFTILTPPGIDLFSENGPIKIPINDTILLRVDFIREVDELLTEMDVQPKDIPANELDAQSVALRMQQQQRESVLQQVRDLRDLAASLKW